MTVPPAVPACARGATIMSPSEMLLNLPAMWASHFGNDIDGGLDRLRNVLSGYEITFSAGDSVLRIGAKEVCYESSRPETERATIGVLPGAPAARQVRRPSC
jgi:hypothetical protein